MKLLRAVGLVVTAVVIVGPSLFSQNPPKREFRGAWIGTVLNLDWPNMNASPNDQMNHLMTILDDLKKIGINAVLFQVRPACDAFYASPYEPWSYWLNGQQGRAPLPYYDPLEFAVAEAHKRGMELHAWFNPYRAEVSAGSYGLDPGHVAVEHPEWTFIAGSLRMVNPGIPAVRDYVTMVIADVVTRYDVDGVHFDDYFYPYNSMADQDSAAFADYNPLVLSLEDWRRDNVNKLVQQVHDTITVLKPHVKFGISPFGIWKHNNPPSVGDGTTSAYDDIYCDAIAWLQARSIDYLTPQIYWAINSGATDYSILMPWWADSVEANGRHFYPGQAPYRIDYSNWPASELPNQLNLNRANNKTLGSVFFRATYGLTDDLKGFADSLKSNFYRYPAIPPVMTWIDSVKPLVPSNIRYEQIAGSGPAVLRWDPPSAASDGDTASFYVVYRLTSPVVQQSDIDDPSNIVAVEGKPYSQLGPPPPGGPYYYAVTGLDRIKNESDPTGTISVSAPAAPLLASPASGATDQPLSALLTWYSDPIVSAYDLQFATDSTFVSGIIFNGTGLTDTSHVVTLSDGPITYYWRLRSNNAGGTSLYSEVRSLTGGFPVAPLLAFPAHGTTNVTTDPTFTWHSLAGVDSFQFQLSTSSVFTTTLVDTSGLTDTSFAVLGLEGFRNHYWRLRAFNGVGEGLWSTANGFRTGPVVFVEETTELPEDFALYQNYPNPFNPSTTIRFALPTASVARLMVYDLLGREVAVLVDDYLQAGTHSVELDGSRLTSGTYVYVLTAGGKRMTRKMILLK